MTEEFEARDIIMSDGTGNPAGLFSVKGMVALVCHRFEVVFFPLVPKYAVRPLAALCNDLEDTVNVRAVKHYERPFISID